MVVLSGVGGGGWNSAAKYPRIKSVVDKDGIFRSDLSIKVALERN
jgi:hypothetical protein